MTYRELQLLINTPAGVVGQVWWMKAATGTRVYVTGMFYDPAIHAPGQQAFHGQLKPVTNINTTGRGLANLILDGGAARKAAGLTTETLMYVRLTDESIWNISGQLTGQFPGEAAGVNIPANVICLGLEAAA